jgi:sugar (pentulose or hexulose) kinase
MPYYAGIDLGATHIRAAVADAEGAVVAADSRPTPGGPSGEDVSTAVLEALRDVCDGASVDPTDLRAVGFGQRCSLCVHVQSAGLRRLGASGENTVHSEIACFGVPSTRIRFS